MALSAVEIQRRLREFEKPTFGYRKGKDGEIEKELFNGNLPKGWYDSPAVDGAKEGTFTGDPFATSTENAEEEKESAEPDSNAKQDSQEADEEANDGEEEAGSEEEVEFKPPYDKYSFKDLCKFYKQRTGQVIKFGTSMKAVMDLLEALDSADAKKAEEDA